MLNSYGGLTSTTEDYLNYLHNKNFIKSKYLNQKQVLSIFDKIGVFRLKGYVKEIKHLKEKKIDDLLIIYFFDRYFSKVIFDLTSRIESKLKSVLITECYSRSNNHFFYLLEKNHKWKNYKIDFSTINNWKINTNIKNSLEAYSHYILFYLQNYDFKSNKKRYLGSDNLIDIDDLTYNYPPFKYLIESATLGSVISFIKSLKLKKYRYC
ncbi:MAG: Abi family protein [Campylobacterota bacterium]|nr:Abi family protein [Campylobacterota bacterium]